MGLEPTVSCLASRRVNQLRYNRTRKAARGTRPPNLLITSELHYHCAIAAYAMPGYHRRSSLSLLAEVRFLNDTEATDTF